jgi:hypothetical protein
MYAASGPRPASPRCGSLRFTPLPRIPEVRQLAVHPACPASPRGAAACGGGHRRRATAPGRTDRRCRRPPHKATTQPPWRRAPRGRPPSMPPGQACGAAAAMPGERGSQSLLLGPKRAGDICRAELNRSPGVDQPAVSIVQGFNPRPLNSGGPG